MRKFLLVLTAVFWVAGTHAAANGETFPAFSSQTLDGAPVTEAIFAAKKLTMVNIWATWCGPCIAEMPDLGALNRSMPEGTQLIGILEDSESVENAKAILARAQADFPNILVVGNMFTFTLEYVPTTIFVDSEGNIVGPRLVGARGAAGYRAAIQSILGGTSGENSITLPSGLVGGVVAADKDSANAGETVKITIKPDSGYTLNSITAYKTGDGSIEVLLYCTGNICEFVMPDYPVTVYASFYVENINENIDRVGTDSGGGCDGFGLGAVMMLSAVGAALKRAKE